MAGVKGRSGAKKGQGSGTTNNPLGRPKGSANKIPASLRSNIASGVESNMDDFWQRLKNSDDKEFIATMTNLLRLIVPRPLNEDETESNLLLKNEIIKRMMGEK